MTDFTKTLLSGSTNGRGIKVTGTGTGSSVTVHTAVSGTADIDEVWLFAQNSNASSIVLTVEFGGTTDPDDLIEKTIPAVGGGLTNVIAGLPINNSLVIKAFAATANEIELFGYVNRIS